MAAVVFRKHKRPCRDLTGKTFGALRVLGYLGQNGHGAERYLCWCRLCGSESEHRGYHLRAKAVKSCGREECRRLVRRLRA